MDGNSGSRGVGEKWRHLLVTLCGKASKSVLKVSMS